MALDVDLSPRHGVPDDWPQVDHATVEEHEAEALPQIFWPCELRLCRRSEEESQNGRVEEERQDEEFVEQCIQLDPIDAIVSSWQCQRLLGIIYFV